MFSLSKSFTKSPIFTRSIHYKQHRNNYPKVNINDVTLNKPRSGFRKERDPLLSQTVTDTLFPNTAIKAQYVEQGKPVPIKYRSNSDQIARRNYEKFQEEVALGEAHFRVGEKKVYFPSGRICLLRPNAKHTPYQAKFLVPKSMNKMDLRDYLWHVYGLRALNVTVQLLHAPFTRGLTDYARYRGPQLKKMTVDMQEPFIWPELDANLVESARINTENERKVIEHKTGTNSDLDKPLEAYGGMYKQPVLPNAFVSKKLRQIGGEELSKYQKEVDSKGDKELVEKFLGL
jgi:large subunit ribosomal protein L23